MRKIFTLHRRCLLVLVTLFSVSSFAQSDSTLIKRISKSFCDELSKKDLAKIKPANMDMELGLVILGVISKYEKEINTEWKLSIDDEKDMETIGEKIGMDAALTCPAFQSFVVNNIDEITGDDATESLSGNFVSLQVNQFSFILIKNKSGKEEKIWWFQHFEGADELATKAAQLKGKAVTVSYKEIEIYDAALKEYRKIKVLAGFTIDN